MHSYYGDPDEIPNYESESYSRSRSASPINKPDVKDENPVTPDPVKVISKSRETSPVNVKYVERKKGDTKKSSYSSSSSSSYSSSYSSDSEEDDYMVKKRYRTSKRNLQKQKRELLLLEEKLVKARRDQILDVCFSSFRLLLPLLIIL